MSDVSLQWLKQFDLEALSKVGCPFCGEKDGLIERKPDESFEAQVGCTKCDKWIHPVRLRER